MLGPHSGPGNHAGARVGRHQHYIGRPELRPHQVRNRFGAHQGHVDHSPRGLFLGLLDGRRNFVRLPVAPADFPLTVADNDERGKAETPPAFDHRGAALDLHRLVYIFATC